MPIKITLYIGNIPSYEMVTTQQPKEEEFSKKLSMLNRLLLKVLNTKSSFPGFLMELAPIEQLILKIARQMLLKKKINIKLSSLSLKKEGIGMLKLSVGLERIDYLSLVKMIDLHKIQVKDEKVKKVIDTLLAMDNMPDRLLEAVFHSITQEETDHLVVEIAKIYKDEIINGLNPKIKESCPVQIRNMEIENEEDSK